MTKSKITKPMLAGKAPLDLDALNFPVMASPKLDGVRCLIIDGKALTRTFKPIPNDFVREWLEANMPNGFDGELMPRDKSVPFKTFCGAVRRKTGEPDFVYCVFDFTSPFVDGTCDLDEFFSTRYGNLELWNEMHGTYLERFAVVEHMIITDAERLSILHTELCDAGYEGTMLRDPNGPYKCGRSTTKRGELLKLKDFDDEEALIIGVEELMHNDNEAGKDEFGRTKRSSHKENLRPAGTMGKLRCRMLSDGTEFSVGTGFTAADRASWWAMRNGVVSNPTHITVKHQPDPGGRQPGQAPRFPVFVACRDLKIGV